MSVGGPEWSFSDLSAGPVRADPISLRPEGFAFVNLRTDGRGAGSNTHNEIVIEYILRVTRVFLIWRIGNPLREGHIHGH